MPPGVRDRLRAAGCVLAEEEARLLATAARSAAELTALVDERVAGTPLEHVLGWAEFCGLRVVVGPGVYVPRPRTELLAREAAALARARARDPGPGSSRGPGGVPGRTVLAADLCCGSGALGAALLDLAGRAPGCRVHLHAADLDAAAVRCARRNLEPVGGRVHEGDLFEALPAVLRGRLDIVMANVPYVPTGAIELLPREARLHEPRAALDGGADGLDVLRRLAEAAPGWLAPGGHLLVETSADQARAAVEVVGACGLAGRLVRSAAGAVVLVGSRPPRRLAGLRS